MTYGQLLHTVPEGLRELYRRYENISKKLIQTRWSIVFNTTCLDKDVLPNYSRLRHHDPAVAHTGTTTKYRKYLVEREISCGQTKKQNHKLVQEKLLRDIESFDCNVKLKKHIENELDMILDNSDKVVQSKTLKKLNSLCYDKAKTSKSVRGEKDINSYINLSDHELTDNEKRFLDLGLNCHLQPKYDKLHKKTELEVLYQNLLKLESQKSIAINPNLADQLRAESTKHRNIQNRSILTPSLKEGAHSLKSNNNIVIRKADKSSIYVIINKEEYISKLETILSDCSKFKRINRNPIDNLKQKANKLIEALNAAQGDIKLSKIIGDFQPGYIYGNVKTHKPNNPLRPIISQIPTPTYNLAKSLNKIISPYIPNQYTLKSSNDFIDLLQTNDNNGLVASLDVSSLFTNVPIDRTIEIILQQTFKHPSLQPPKIPQYILKHLLELCTKEAPFRCPQGKLYLQTDGVAMGSPLGPTFANFYMGSIEDEIFQNPDNKPHIYARYVDDIFLQVENEAELMKLKELFESHSVLDFTYELSVNEKLPFLDVLVDSSENRFLTTVFHKPTDQGSCLNGKSECTEKYKISVINNYLNRAYKISSSWSALHAEIHHIKERLRNNNYSNEMVELQIRKFINLKLKSEQKQEKSPIPIYYENQFHPNYKMDERIIRDIVTKNIECQNPSDKLQMRIFYRNRKTSNLVMKNNLLPPLKTLEKTNIIYNFCCPMSHSEATNYIGFTQNTLSQRLTSHRQNGSIHNHFSTVHNIKPTREHLTQNTKIIGRAKDRLRLTIKEALLISQEKPIINKQFDNFTNVLKLHRPASEYMRNRPSEESITPPVSSLPVSVRPIPLSTKPNQQIPSKNPNPSNTVHRPTLQIPSNIPQPLPDENTQPISKNECTVYTSQPTSGIPDMEIVLNNFGINTKNFITVDVNQYHWLKFNTHNISAPTQSPLTIAQRIHTMIRDAKNLHPSLNSP